MATFTTRRATGSASPQTNEGIMAIADKTYWLDANKQLVEEEPESGFVLINEGQEIPAEMAEKYGLGKVTPKSDEAKAEASDESEAPVKSAKPTANKKASPSANKGAK